MISFVISFVPCDWNAASCFNHIRINRLVRLNGSVRRWLSTREMRTINTRSTIFYTQRNSCTCASRNEFHEISKFNNAVRIMGVLLSLVFVFTLDKGRELRSVVDAISSSCTLSFRSSSLQPITCILTTRDYVRDRSAGLRVNFTLSVFFCG